MGKEKYIGESAIKDSPRKRLSLMLRDGSVDTKKIADKAVTTEKIANGAVTREKLSDSILDDVKASTEEALKDKFLPTAGGTVTSSVNFDFGLDDVSVEISPEGISTVRKVEADKQSVRAALSPESLEISKVIVGKGKQNIITVNDEGVTSKGFITNDQSIQGLLGNDGSIVEELTEDEVAGLFV